MKSTRQKKMIEIIQTYPVETQEELAGYLSAAGFQVTQATVSRDIRELKLTKVPRENGRQCYALVQPQQERREAVPGSRIQILKEGFIIAEAAQNILVIKTVSGMAMAVAAVLDTISFPEIVGSIAGDDTVMCVTRTNEDAECLKNKLATYTNVG